MKDVSYLAEKYIWESIITMPCPIKQKINLLRRMKKQDLGKDFKKYMPTFLDKYLY